MPRRRRYKSKFIRTDCNRELVISWIIKLLETVADKKDFFNLIEDNIKDLKYLNIENTVEELEPSFHGKEGASEAQAIFKVLVDKNKKNTNVEITGDLAINIGYIAKSLNLSKVQKRVIGLFSLIKFNNVLSAAFDAIGSDLNEFQACEVIANLLDFSFLEVENALSSKGMLIKTGIIEKSSHRVIDEVSSLYFIPDFLVNNLFVANNSIFDLLSHILKGASKVSLTSDDFPHVEKDINIVSKHLEQTKIDKSSGTNFLIYGPPGTGKTELVKLIADLCNFNLYEVLSCDSDDDSMSSKERIKSYLLSQAILANSKNPLILFDEVEDVFQSSFQLMFRGRTSSKAWLNSILESNQVPSIWVTNDIDSIDSAYVRRFDFVFKVGTPPIKVRKKIFNKYFSRYPIKPEIEKKICDERFFKPAHIEKLSNLSCSLWKTSKSKIKLNELLLKSANNMLEAASCKKINISKSKIQLNYSIKYINADINLSKLSKGLVDNKCGRILLMGPPGTGKTAFGKYVAQQIGLPFLVKKASDLLSPYVGQTEMNLAQLFDEAKDDSSVIQIDEIDSFLQSREGANRSWEVSQVNELLTQLESFEGVFIASTNHVNTIDAAAIRRFDFKISLSYMKKSQVLTMAKAICDTKTPKEIERVKHLYQSLKYITPGDFNNIIRQKNIMGIELTLTKIAELLQEEQNHKLDANMTKIGFI